MVLPGSMMSVTMTKPTHQSRAVAHIIKDLTHFNVGKVKLKGLTMTSAQAKSILKRNFKDHNIIGVRYTQMNYNTMGYYHIGGNTI